MEVFGQIELQTIKSVNMGNTQETQLEPNILDYRALLSLISKVKDIPLYLELINAAGISHISSYKAGMAAATEIYLPNANPEKSEQ
jgi:hypothetical protein